MKRSLGIFCLCLMTFRCTEKQAYACDPNSQCCVANCSNDVNSGDIDGFALWLGWYLASLTAIMSGY